MVMIPVAAFNAAVYGHRHRDKSYSPKPIDINKVKRLYENREFIVKYLKQKFNTINVSYYEELSDITIFKLDFRFFYCCIKFTNDYVALASELELQQAAYSLARDSIIKFTEDHYINKDTD